MSQPVIIIGGGVIGLSIAYHLALKGQKSIILEKSLVGLETTHAAAGMITPASEVLFGEEKLLHFFMESQNLYPNFISQLEKLAPSTDFTQNGTLIVALDKDDENELERMYNFQKELGLSVNRLTPQEVLEKEAALTPNLTMGLWASGEYHIDNRQLATSLSKAYRAQGGIIRENCCVTEIQIENGKAISVIANGEKINSDNIVLASGTAPFPKGLQDINMPNLRPVKGQAMEFRSKTPAIKRAIRSINRFPMYLVPRSDGRLILGATTEEMGFDNRVTAGAMFELTYAAMRVLPALEEMEFVGAWTGFRAAFRDNAPVVGPTSINGLHLALGFYRHGILLTPLAGKIMADYLVDGAYSKWFDDFGINRFVGT